VNGFVIRISAAVGSVLVVVFLLGLLGGAGARASALDGGKNESQQAEKDHQKSVKDEQKAHEDEVKALDQGKQAEELLDEAKVLTDNAVTELEAATKELTDAANTTDPTVKAELETEATKNTQDAEAKRSEAEQKEKEAKQAADKAEKDKTAADKAKKAAEEADKKAKKEQLEAQNQAQGHTQVWICHNGHKQSVDDDATYGGHGHHKGDTIPAPENGGCPAANPVSDAENNGSSPPVVVEAANDEQRKGDDLQEQGDETKKEAGENTAEAKGNDASSQSNEADAAKTKDEAMQEHQQAASQTDPTKAADLEAIADGKDQLASAQEQLSEIEQALSDVQQTEAAAGNALAAEDHAAAEVAMGNAQEGQEAGQEGAAASRRIFICHATGKTSPAFVEIEVPQTGLGGHGARAGDIVPAPARGCPSSTSAGDVARVGRGDASVDGGPLRAALAANKLSLRVGGIIRLFVSVENLRSVLARHLKLCGSVPSGFSLFDRPRLVRLVGGTPCLTRASLRADSVAAIALHLRLNARAGRRRVGLRLLLAVGALARRAQVPVAVHPGVKPAPAAPPPVTG
jgi:hypothetical protein